jgi:DNA-binding winged helix-turn-helix (wHTH) protein
MLGKHASGVVTKEQLIAGPWRGHTVSDDAIYRCIFRARKILAMHDCIVTVRGRGFRLVLAKRRPMAVEGPAMIARGKVVPVP